MIAVYTAAVFVGAALVFLVQPLIAKQLLPRLGGSPAVWIACMVFFQAALLADADSNMRFPSHIDAAPAKGQSKGKPAGPHPTKGTNKAGTKGGKGGNGGDDGMGR